MKKEQLIQEICEKKYLNDEVMGPELSWIYDEIFAAIVEAVAKGKTVEIPNFGIFYVCEQRLGFTTVLKKIPTFSPDAFFRVTVRKAEAERKIEAEVKHDE